MPETGTDDCHVCVRPVEGTRTGCRQCAEYDENDQFVRWIGKATPPKQFPNLIHFSLNGAIGGEVAERNYTQEFPSLGPYSAEMTQYTTQGIVDNIPSSGTLKHPRAFADYYATAWELGANVRNNFPSAEAAREYFENSSTGCKWIMASLTSVAKVWQYGNGLTFTTVSKEWGPYVCGSVNVGPSGMGYIGFTNTTKLQVMKSKVVSFPTGETERVIHGPESWQYPPDMAAIVFGLMKGVGFSYLIEPNTTSGSPCISGTSGYPWSWKDGNKLDYYAQLGGGTDAGLSGGGDNTFPLDADRNYHWFETGDPHPYTDPTYYSTYCRSGGSYRAYCNQTRFEEGWAFILQVEGQYNYGPPYGSEGGGTVAWLKLYSITGQQYVEGNQGTGRIITSNVTKRGYLLPRETEGYFVSEWWDTHKPGAPLLCNVNDTTQQVIGVVFDQVDGPPIVCPGPPGEYYSYNIFQFDVYVTPPTDSGLNTGCCNRYYGIPYTSNIFTASVLGGSAGRHAGNYPKLEDPTNNSWWNMKYWDTSDLNVACDFMIHQNNFGLGFRFEITPEESTELKSKVGWYGVGGLGGGFGSGEIAVWKVKKSLAHCDDRHFELELIYQRNETSGVSWPYGKPSYPTSFPETGELWW